MTTSNYTFAVGKSGNHVYARSPKGVVFIYAHKNGDPRVLTPAQATNIVKKFECLDKRMEGSFAPAAYAWRKLKTSK